MARRVVDNLMNEELIITEMSRDELAATVTGIIMEELMVENRINDEVREMLKQYDREIELGRLDYRRLFDMTKKKVVRDRGVII